MVLLCDRPIVVEKFNINLMYKSLSLLESKVKDIRSFEECGMGELIRDFLSFRMGYNAFLETKRIKFPRTYSYLVYNINPRIHDLLSELRPYMS